jgi:hypothetical protein
MDRSDEATMQGEVLGDDGALRQFARFLKNVAYFATYWWL